jgi:hypothetical protein
MLHPHLAGRLGNLFVLIEFVCRDSEDKAIDIRHASLLFHESAGCTKDAPRL